MSGERTALKEWAVLCDALADGEIIAMVRKGGIREQRAGFAVRHERFLLYPTWFHEKSAELQPRFASRIAAASVHRPPDGVVRIGLVADVAAMWHVRELERLRAIEPFHGMAWPAVVSRFEYRGKPELRVIAVKVSRLPSVHDVPETSRYLGCVSWVALDEAIDVAGAVPVLAEPELAARVGVLTHALGRPEPPAPG
ncbi:MAG: DUF1802 family protein [Gemmatimonadaceae bacterium]